MLTFLQQRNNNITNNHTFLSINLGQLHVLSSMQQLKRLQLKDITWTRLGSV